MASEAVRTTIIDVVVVVVGGSNGGRGSRPGRRDIRPGPQYRARARAAASVYPPPSCATLSPCFRRAPPRVGARAPRSNVMVRWRHVRVVPAEVVWSPTTRVFARGKEWMSESEGRGPVKKR